MNRKSWIFSFTQILALSSITFRVNAGSPVWSFQPQTATTLSISSKATATVKYNVTIQSHEFLSLAMQPIIGVNHH